MKKREFDPMYWSPDKLLSYNKLFNFVISNRGSGKSFACKRLVISRFLKTGEQFVYIRRYIKEFGLLKTFFNDIADFFPDHEFEVRGNDHGYFIIDGKVAGYFIALNKSEQLKSVAYPLVTTIIFEEFIIEQGSQSYLKNEVRVFLNLYETIARTRDVIVLFVANAITTLNPYFIFFNIYLRPNAKFTTGSEYCVERFKGEDYTKMKRETRFGRLITGTEYGNYAIENEFYGDSTSFIERMRGRCAPLVVVVYDGVEYTVWQGIESRMIYFNTKRAPESVRRVCVTVEDHRPDFLLIRSIKTDFWFKEILFAYEHSIVRFDSMKSREVFYNIMSFNRY